MAKRILGEKNRRELRGSECGWHRTPELSQLRAAQGPHTSAAWKESGGLAKSSDEHAGAGLDERREDGRSELARSLRHWRQLGRRHFTEHRGLGVTDGSGEKGEMSSDSLVNTQLDDLIVMGHEWC